MTIRVWEKNKLSSDVAMAQYDSFFQNEQLGPAVQPQTSNSNWIIRKVSSKGGVANEIHSQAWENYLYIIELAPTDSLLISTAEKIISTFQFVPNLPQEGRG